MSAEGLCVRRPGRPFQPAAPSGPGSRLVPVGGGAGCTVRPILTRSLSSVPLSAAAVTECTAFCMGELADSSICWFWPLGQPGSLGQFVL